MYMCFLHVSCRLLIKMSLIKRFLNSSVIGPGLAVLALILDSVTDQSRANTVDRGPITG